MGSSVALQQHAIRNKLLCFFYVKVKQHKHNFPVVFRTLFLPNFVASHICFILISSLIHNISFRPQDTHKSETDLVEVFFFLSSTQCAKEV